MVRFLAGHELDMLGSWRTFPVIIMVLIFRSASTVRFDRLSQDHPFEIDRSGKAWEFLSRWYGSELNKITIEFDSKDIDPKLLKLAHDPEFVDKHLADPSAIASTFQWPALSSCSIADLQEHLLKPISNTTAMVAGALSRCQLTRDTIFCLSGGYHHASFASGGGFCLFSDIAIAIAKMRKDGRLRANDTILYIDTDAHFANGVAKYSEQDPRIVVLDVFNRNAYPMFAGESVRLSMAIDFPVPLNRGTGDDEYVTMLSKALSKLKESFVGKPKPAFAIYTAGMDPYVKDRLGGLALTKKGLSERDTLVFDCLKEMQIARIVLPGGGYSADSAELYATCVAENGIKKPLPRIV
jgi:histone deacetylase 11